MSSHPAARACSWKTLSIVALVAVLLVLVIVWLVTYSLDLTTRLTSTHVTTESFSDYAAGEEGGEDDGVLRHNPRAKDPLADLTPEVLRTYESEHRTTPRAIYDAEYAGLYQTIVDAPKYKLVEFEVDDLLARTGLKEFASKAVILDIGCGTGTHLDALATHLPTAELYGLDQSRHMLAAAEVRTSSHRGRVRFLNGDMNDPDAVYEGMCTHLVCYYFSFYYAKSSRRFFENAHRWLQPRGFLVVHLVDPNNFDPIPEVANPLRGISLQRYYDERKTGAKVVLRHKDTATGTERSRLYTCDFQHDPDAETSVLTESIASPDDLFVRYHTTKLRMPHHEAVVQAARRAGFRLRHVTALHDIGDEYEYLVYLQRDD